MSEEGLGRTLPHAARGTLLTEAERLARLQTALPQIRAILAGETDAVALFATLARLLWEVFPQATWCGFYRRVGPAMLAVGPYQGGMGCLRIDFARGVCGAAARTAQIQIVPDVQKFEGHIACDAQTQSEVVIPVFDAAGEVRAVLDLDAAVLNGFGEVEAQAVDALLRETFGKPDVVF